MEWNGMGWNGMEGMEWNDGMLYFVVVGFRKWISIVGYLYV